MATQKFTVTSHNHTRAVVTKRIGPDNPSERFDYRWFDKGEQCVHCSPKGPDRRPRYDPRGRVTLASSDRGGKLPRGIQVW